MPLNCSKVNVGRNPKVMEGKQEDGIADRVILCGSQNSLQGQPKQNSVGLSSKAAASRNRCWAGIDEGFSSSSEQAGGSDEWSPLRTSSEPLVRTWLHAAQTHTAWASQATPTSILGFSVCSIFHFDRYVQRQDEWTSWTCLSAHVNVFALPVLLLAWRALACSCKFPVKKFTWHVMITCYFVRLHHLLRSAASLAWLTRSSCLSLSACSLH